MNHSLCSYIQVLVYSNELPVLHLQQASSVGNLHWKKQKNSTKQKNNVFTMEFYWKMKGIQNSAKMSLTHYFTTEWNIPMTWNFEGI